MSAKHFTYLLTILFLLALGGSVAFSSGSNSAEFLEIGVGARPMGLGGAFGAVCDDPSGMYWNPAGAAKIKRKEITLMHNKHFQDINYQFLAYAHPIQGTQLTLGGALNYLSIGDIEGYDVDGRSTGKFNAYNAFGLFCFSQGIGKYLSLGINTKFIQEKLEKEQAQTLTFDIGGLISNPKEDFTLGLSIQNIGGRLKFVKDKEPLPQNTKIGFAYRGRLNLPLSEDLSLPTEKGSERLHNVVASIDINIPLHDSNYIALGCEYWLYNWFALRLGYRTKFDIGDGLHYGLGFAHRDLGLDYVFVPYGDLGDSHRISLSFKFGSYRKGFADVIREEQIAIHYARGERYYQEGALMSAKEEFMRVRELDPTHKEAREGLDKIINVIYMQGLDLYEAGKYTEALKQWQNVLALEPNHAGANRYLELTQKKIKEQEKLSKEELKKAKEEERKRRKRRKELIPIP